MMNDLRERTTEFALRVVKLVEALPASSTTRVLGTQVLRSGTSVGAQYREACRSRSTAEMISKLESTLQELDETAYWFDLLVGSGVVRESKLRALRDETEQLTAILVACVKKLKVYRRR
jgi:four helix bundle protein